MTKWLIGTALSLMIVSPAAAQLLGGSGGGILGGSLGGAGRGAAGGMLGETLGRATGNAAGSARSNGTVRTQRSVDARNGKVSASGDTSGATALDGTTTMANRSLGGSAAGSGSASGSADAQLVGTDALASAARNALATGRGVVSRGREEALNMGGRAVNPIRGAAGSVAGGGNADGSIGFNGLALAGTAAAEGAGTFDVARGMDVTDARGRVIGTVQQVRTTADGAVQAVAVAVGKRIAALPAANFSGSGDVLVSQMSKAEITRTARDQQAD